MFLITILQIVVMWNSGLCAVKPLVFTSYLKFVQYFVLKTFSVCFSLNAKDILLFSIPRYFCSYKSAAGRGNGQYTAYL